MRRARETLLITLVGTLAGALLGLILAPSPRTRRIPIPFRKGKIVPLFKEQTR